MASRYGSKANTKVARAMHERKAGTLKSGRSGKTVRSRKQAIAIGLSEARREGGKVPPPPGRRRSTRAKQGSGSAPKSTARSTRRGGSKRAASSRR